MLKKIRKSIRNFDEAILDFVAKIPPVTKTNKEKKKDLKEKIIKKYESKKEAENSRTKEKEDRRNTYSKESNKKKLKNDR